MKDESLLPDWGMSPQKLMSCPVYEWLLMVIEIYFEFTASTIYCSHVSTKYHLKINMSKTFPVIKSRIYGQCLSQDLETGCIKLAVVKFWGVQIFKGDH